MKSWSCWTGKGVFEVRAEVILGMLTFVLRFEDQVLDRYLHASSACASVAAGEWDETLGFKASELGVSASPDGWKGLM
jgi:hypothetical protein